MNSGTLFALAILLFVTAYLIKEFGHPSNAIRYFKTKDGKGVLIGIVLFIGLALASTFVKADEVWFTYGEVYVGMDEMKGVSPQCKSGSQSDKSTSNGGVRFNIYRSQDRRFHWNLKYTHHSCAFNPDRNGYDALGFEFTYRFFMR